MDEQPIDTYKVNFRFKEELFTSYLSLYESAQNNISEDDCFLTTKEIEQLSKFDGLRKTEFLISRFLIKNDILKYYPEVRNENIEILKGVFGQPILKAANSTFPFGVSISHKKLLIGNLLFDERHPLGLDIELLSKNKEVAFYRNLTENEKKIGTDHRISTVIWTAKEALTKILRCGQTAPFRFFEVFDFEINNKAYIGFFKFFQQYKFYSFEYKSHIVTLVFPRKSKIEFNLLKAKK